MKSNKLVLSLTMLGVCTPIHAYDVTDSFSVGGVLAGAGQCQKLSEKAGFDDECKGALPIQPEFSLRPTDTDEFFMKFGFAVGNGLNTDEDKGRFRSPFALATWAADLEDDVKDINGRNRDYLLTAWYRHEFQFQNDSSLGATFGIIDSTDYLDENAYANDEFGQFMNEVFVNSTVSFLTSYDVGGALEWNSGNWSIRSLAMNVGKNDNDNEFNFFGATVGYTLDSAWGEGNYRLTLTGTNEKFLNEDGTDDNEGLFGATLSFDQQIDSNLGAFLRLGWQNDDAAVDYDALYSGGLNIGGGLWNRADDNVGIGLAYLNGGNQDLSKTYAVETYYRAVFSDYFALTADVQYLKDELNTDEDDPEGWIFSLRLTAEF